MAYHAIRLGRLLLWLGLLIGCCVIVFNLKWPADPTEANPGRPLNLVYVVAGAVLVVIAFLADRRARPLELRLATERQRRMNAKRAARLNP